MIAGEIGPAPAELTVAVLAGALAGAIMMGGSLMLIRAGRHGRRVAPTRLALGVSGLILGYHVVAWSLPDGWLSLSVPIANWWIVVLAAAACVGGSLLADRLEGRVTRV